MATRAKKPRTTPAVPTGSAYDAAVRYLGSRQRSVAEIQRHLRGKRHDDAAIDGAIEKLRELGYVDDVAFARYWLEQRDRFRPKGERALRSELAAKGVPRDAVDLALGEREAGGDVARAKDALLRGAGRWRALGGQERRERMQRFLLARGFGYDVIEEVVREVEGPQPER